MHTHGKHTRLWDDLSLSLSLPPPPLFWDSTYRQAPAERVDASRLSLPRNVLLLPRDAASCVPLGSLRVLPTSSPVLMSSSPRASVLLPGERGALDLSLAAAALSTPSSLSKCS